MQRALSAAPDHDRAGFPSIPAADASSQPLILIIDDEALIVDLMEHHFSNAGYRVARAYDGAEAIAHLEASMPDLVISDVMMPVLNGTEVLRQIRQTPKWRHIPVIMLTMRDRETDAVDAFQGGASDYVAKPFMIGDLLERAKRLIAPQMWDAPALALQGA